MDQTQYLTKEKFAELKKELENLKTVRRKEVAGNLEYARSLGDLSENAEYQEAREMQANVEDRIITIENSLKTAEIVGDRHTDTVGMGSVVHVKKEGSSSEHKYKIVGSEEANAHEGKISNLSPLGHALMGKGKGDSITLSTPKGKTGYTIVSIG